MLRRVLTSAFAVASAISTAARGPVRRPDGGSGLLPEKAPAPDFNAPDQSGRMRSLGEFRGHPVVLYFYPRDATPGCTKEACAFRDAWDQFTAEGAQVLGVSTDDVASHAKFAADRNLPFPLLADRDGTILRSYGVGTTFGMASRVTFVIDRAGMVANVFPDVDPGVHTPEVIAVIRALPK